MTTIAFISGHLDVDEAFFTKYYKSSLDDANKNMDNFIIGNAFGIDFLAFKYLLQIGVNPSRITVYCFNRSHDTSHYSASYYQELGVSTKEGFTGFMARDAQMTANSDYDIAVVRSEEETKKLYGSKYRKGRISGTQQNINRRLKKNKLL